MSTIQKQVSLFTNRYIYLFFGLLFSLLDVLYDRYLKLFRILVKFEFEREIKMNKTILSIMLILPMISLAQDSINKGDKVKQRPTENGLSERLKIGVEKGIITQEQADERYEAFTKNDVNSDDKLGIETRYLRLGVEIDELNRIKTKLKNSGITAVQLNLVLTTMIRMIHVAKSQENEIDFSPRFQTYFENKVGLNDLQIQVVKGITKRVARRL